ncbi:MAG: Resolvase domain protein [Clostridia bacterium 41_269]|nr:MAG: Resolvase domain protein [Clostridia bacterium 41_269]
MTRAAALYRVSTKKQLKSEDDSIPAQQHTIRNFAAEKGWELVKEYIEPGVSAFKISSDKRDILQDVLSDALQGKFDVLLIFKADRLSRQSFEYPLILKSFYDAGVEVIAVADAPGGRSLNVDDQMDKLLRFIEGWQAETESKNTSIRVKTSMMDMAKRGHWSGGRPPYGFKLPDSKKGLPLEINQKEAEILLLMKRLYLEEEWGSKKIAVYLNEHGYRTRENRLWTDARVRTVLQNPIIAGLPAYNRTKPGSTPTSRVRIKNWYDINNPEIIIPRDENGNPKPIKEYTIISLEEWQKLMEVMKKRSKNTKPDARSMDSTALLTGFLKCGYCGKGFISSRTRNAKTVRPNGKVYVYKKAVYRCSTHARKGSAFCSGQGSYSQKKIDGIFMSELESFLKNVDLGSLEHYVNMKQASARSQISRQIAQLERELKKVRRRLNSWVDRLNQYFADPEGSIYSEEMMAREIKRAEEEEKVITEQIAELKAELQQKQVERDSLKQFARLAPRWFEIFKESPVETKKKMLKQIIDRIVLRRDKMEIVYNINLMELSEAGSENAVRFKIAVEM